MWCDMLMSLSLMCSMWVCMLVGLVFCWCVCLLNVMWLWYLVSRWLSDGCLSVELCCLSVLSLVSVVLNVCVCIVCLDIVWCVVGCSFSM